MVAWVWTDTERIEGSRKERSVTSRTSHEASSLSLGTRIMSMIRTEMPVGMEPAVVETNPGSRTRKLQMRHPQQPRTGTAMGTDLLTEAVDGEKRNEMIIEEIETVVREMSDMREATEAIDVGTETEISDRNESRHGSMSQQRRNQSPTRSIQRTISRSGRNSNDPRILEIGLLKLPWKNTSPTNHRSLVLRSLRSRLRWK